MTVLNYTRQEEVDVERLLWVIDKLTLKIPNMSYSTLLQLLSWRDWEVKEDNGKTLLVAHPFNIPRTIRIPKEDLIPPGTVKAILKAAGIIS